MHIFRFTDREKGGKKGKKKRPKKLVIFLLNKLSFYFNKYNLLHQQKPNSIHLLFTNCLHL